MPFPKMLLATTTLSLATFFSTARAQQIYWTGRGPDAIQRANLDGSNVQGLLPGLSSYPVGVALDIDGGKIYWTDQDRYPPRISRANLDGSGIEHLVTTGLHEPYDIALDPTGGKMYWTDYTHPTSKIQRANLDGSDVEDLATGVTISEAGLALDLAGGHLYWTVAGSIRRANLDDDRQR